MSRPVIRARKPRSTRSTSRWREVDATRLLPPPVAVGAPTDCVRVRSRFLCSCQHLLALCVAIHHLDATFISIACMTALFVPFHPPYTTACGFLPPLGRSQGWTYHSSRLPLIPRRQYSITERYETLLPLPDNPSLRPLEVVKLLLTPAWMVARGEFLAQRGRACTSSYASFWTLSSIMLRSSGPTLRRPMLAQRWMQRRRRHRRTRRHIHAHL
jgi:hypothetical protein